MKNKIINRIRLEYIILFTFTFLLCFLFPYTGDDWAWGSQIGIDRLSNWFDNYNGRYLGNLIVLALTRNYLIRNIIISATICSTIVIINNLTGKTKLGFYFITSCIVFLPNLILRQSIAWTSGFSNYVTSIFLTLIYISYIKGIFTDEPPKYSALSLIPLTLLGVANTLIVEHLTMYNIILGLSVLIITIIKFKKVYLQHIAYSVGTLIGAVTMFSNSVYRSIKDGNDYYREINQTINEIFSGIKNNYLNVIAKEGFLNNMWINMCLTILCIHIWSKVKNRVSKSKLIIGTMCTWVFIAYTAISLMSKMDAVKHTVLATYAIGLTTVIFVLAIGAFLFVLPVQKNDKQVLLFIYSSIIIVIGPLLVVNPIGSRCLFASYILFTYLLAKLIQIANISNRELRNSLMIACAAGFLYLSGIYFTIYTVDQHRIRRVVDATKSGETTVEIRRLPYAQYVWWPNPNTELWELRFKLFYGIDKDIEFILVDEYSK